MLLILVNLLQQQVFLTERIFEKYVEWDNPPKRKPKIYSSL